MIIGYESISEPESSLSLLLSIDKPKRRVVLSKQFSLLKDLYFS